MKRYLFAAALCLSIFLPANAAAHVLGASTSVGAIMHISPADDPQAGQPVVFHFDFKDTDSQFQPGLCECRLLIEKDNQVILDRSLDEGGSINGLSVDTAPYTFPETGVYTVIVSGAPRPEADFNAFELTYDVRVSRQAIVDTADPAAIRRVSNYIHRGVGVFVLLAIILRKLWSFGLLKGRWTNYIRLFFYTVTGLWIILQILFSRGIANTYETWLLMNGDQQTIHHMLMGISLIIAGIAELFRALVNYKKRHWLSIFTPLSVGFIGFLFAIHPQHGTAEAVAQSEVFHRILAAVLLGGAIAKIIQIYLRRNTYAPRTAAVLGALWLLCGGASAVMLITYSEPLGAYENFQYGSYGSAER